MLRGSMWTLGIRWSIRLTGLVSTVLLARLLTPADYGIVAIAVVIVGAVDVFRLTGERSAIIRHPDPTREHYDSAWTMSVLLGLGLGMIILLLSPISASYFHEPRALAVVQVLAVRTMASGFENIGTLNFQRDLKFHKQFQFNAGATIASFVVTLVAAIVLRNYWALVIGMWTKQIAINVLSYTMEPFRPRFSFTKVREIWSFSIWTLVKGVGMYFNTQIDKIAIGGFAGAALMGRYDVASDLATSPSRELNDPVVTVLFPVMSTVQNDPVKRRTLYLGVLYWSGIICAATSIGVAVVANDMTDLVLGAKWHDVRPLIPWLSLSFGVLGLSSSVYSAFDTLGQPGRSARLQWLRLLCLAIFAFPVAYFSRSLEAVAMTRFFVTLAITPTLFVALGRALDVRLREFVVTLWRPVIAGGLMGAAVLGTNAMLSLVGPPRLAIDIVVGALSFSGVMMFLWQLVGCPDGPEQTVWARLSPAFRLLARVPRPS
jgi:O-antigen/teichoic acid export membrane protein